MPGVTGRPSGPRKRKLVDPTLVILEAATLVGVFLILRSLTRIENNLRSSQKVQQLSEEKF